MTERLQTHCPPPLGTVILRALSRRCPNCGQGPLFSGYLKQVDSCANCHEPYGHIRCDDAAPWLTILLVGHIVVPLAVMFDARFAWQTWLSMIIWPGLTLLLSLVLLPFAKAVFLAVIWATGAPGSERE